MRRLVTTAALAVCAAVSGCAVTGQGMAQNPMDAARQSVLDAVNRFKAQSPLAGQEAVVISMNTDLQVFMEGAGGEFSELFAKLPPAARGSDAYRKNIALMTKIGSGIGKNGRNETLIYVSPELLSDPSMADYVAQIEHSAGKGRANLKADNRMRGADFSLVWARDTANRSITPDAILSAKNHGLLADRSTSTLAK